jgi:hypothetical protein
MQAGLLSRLMGRPAEVKRLPVTIRYLPSALRWEFAKGAIGTAGGLAILVGAGPTPWVGVPLGVVTALFGAYAWQQVRRRRQTYLVLEDRLQATEGKREQEIVWNDLARMRLKYYAFGRKAEQGTLVLYLEGEGFRIKLDSAADEFATLLYHAAQVARQRELTLDPTTVANLSQLGL